MFVYSTNLTQKLTKSDANVNYDDCFWIASNYYEDACNFIGRSKEVSTDSDRDTNYNNYYQKLNNNNNNQENSLLGSFNENKLEYRPKKEYEKREMAVVNASKLSTKKYIDNDNNGRDSATVAYTKNKKPNDASQSSSESATESDDQSK